MSAPGNLPQHLCGDAGPIARAAIISWPVFRARVLENVPAEDRDAVAYALDLAIASEAA